MALEARIKQLLALDENRKCADCGTRSPRWASYSLGVFMCLQCAGFHRALGVHISRVKSCDLDRWTEDQVRAMEAVGNARGREEYGPSYAEVNNTTYLPDAHMLDSFIKSKYVRRLYARGGFGAAFNTPEAATTAATAVWKPRQEEGEDMWADYREPAVDTTSKIRIDWPRNKPTAAAAAAIPEKAQKEPSLIDLFEPAPVVQHVQQQPTAAAAAPFDPFGDFAAAPAAAVAAVPTADLFGLMPATVAAPKPQLMQSSFASFPPLQQQKQQPKPQLSSFDEDFGDFVAAAATAAAAAAKPNPVQQLQQLSLLDDDSENVPPPLPAKDYDPFASSKPVQSLAARDFGDAAAAARPSASPADALADLFSVSLTSSSSTAAAALTPSGAPTTMTTPAAPRMTTDDIMALYGARSPAGQGMQPPSMSSFVPNFGGNGASRA